MPNKPDINNIVWDTSNIEWDGDDKTGPNAEIAGMTPDQLNAIPPMKFGGKATEISKPMPEWKQKTGMAIQEYAPEVGMVAGGTAAALSTANPVASVAGAGLGRAAGKQAVDPLMRILGFKPDGKSFMPSSVGEATTGLKQAGKQAMSDFVSGATNWAANEAIGGIVPKVSSVATKYAESPSKAFIGLDRELANRQLPKVKPLQEKATTLMQSATKPTVAHARTLGDQKRIMETLNKGGYRVNQKSAEKLSSDIDSMETAVDDLISKMGETNRLISKREIISDLKKKQARLLSQKGSKASAQDYAQQIQKEIDALDSLPDFLDPSVVQGYKKDLNYETRGYWGEGEAPSIEAKKALASAYRKSLERIDPQIGIVNRQMKDLIEAERVLDRAVGRVRNANEASLPSHVVLSGGLKNPLTYINMARRAADMPGVKSWRANRAYGKAQNILDEALSLKEPVVSTAQPPSPIGTGFTMRGGPQDVYEPNFTMVNNPEIPQKGLPGSSVKQLPPPPWGQVPSPEPPLLPRPAYGVTESGTVITNKDIENLVRSGVIGNLNPLDRLLRR